MSMAKLAEWFLGFLTKEIVETEAEASEDESRSAQLRGANPRQNLWADTSLAFK